MAKRGRQEPTSITLTVQVDLHEYWTEREIREDLVPPETFDALASALSKAVLQSIHANDVQAISVAEPARRNFARVVATTAQWRMWEGTRSA